MEFEIHITVECSDIDKFVKDCNLLKVKPIIIDTNISNQIMTSSKYKNKCYKQTLSSLNIMLKHLGYIILRNKVEINPSFIRNKDFIYYESHIRLTLPKGYNYTQLKELCKKQNFHLSKNLFKNSDKVDYQMITYRSYTNTFEEFNSKISKMKEELINREVSFDKIEIEECVLDSNENIDKKWLTNLN